MRRWILLAVFILWLAVPALADDGAVVPGIGGSVGLMKPEHSSVRMVGERVFAKIVEDTAMVSCRFVFKNEGKASTVTMGFPEYEYNNADEDPGGPCWRNSTMMYFKSSVDGQPIKTRFVSDSSQRDENRCYHSWHLKEVHFGAGQTRVVVDKYAYRLGDVSYGGTRWFDYILETGSSWKGKIGEAVVIVDVKDAKNIGRPYSAEPSGYVRSGHKFTWRLENIEPNKSANVSIGFTTTPVINGAPSSEWNCRIDSGRAIMPVRNFSSVGVRVKWDRNSRTCVLSYKSRRLKLTPESKTAIVGKSRRAGLPASPSIDGEKMMVPAAAIIRLLGGQASYDSQSMNISMKLAGKELRIY